METLKRQLSGLKPVTIDGMIHYEDPWHRTLFVVDLKYKCIYVKPEIYDEVYVGKFNYHAEKTGNLISECIKSLYGIDYIIDEENYQIDWDSI